MTDTWTSGTPSTLEKGSVHIWIGRVSAAAIAAAWPSLVADERTRATRFRKPADQDRFVVGRGGVRALLAAYTGCAPHHLVFEYGFRGKPHVAASKVHFNVSHAGSVVVWAFALHARVGIDVESVQVPDEELRRGVLAPCEHAWIETLEAGAREKGFYQCWTLKEALVKATGEGFVCDPSALDMQPAASGEVNRVYAGGAVFSVQRLCIAPGYAGAVAVEGVAPRVHTFFWPPH